MRRTLLTVDRVAVERGDRRLLDGLSLTVTGGDLIQLTGANGRGKTSLLRGLAGFARFGISGDITRSAPLLYLGHAPANKPLLTPIENLRWHPSGQTTGDSAVIEAALAAVGLIGYEETPLLQLSAGQQRRVALARLWMTEAPLWLLDEPFTAVDVDGVALLEQRLAEHVDQGGGAVFTSHQPNRFGDRVQLVDLDGFACD